jgi:hypothetical protein
MIIEEKGLGQYVGGIVDILYKYQMQYSCYIMTSNVDNVSRLKAIDSSIHIQLLATPTDEVLETYSGYKNFGFDYDISSYQTLEDLQTTVNKVSSAGFLSTLFTINNETTKDKALGALADFITTELDVI